MREQGQTSGGHLRAPNRREDAIPPLCGTALVPELRSPPPALSRAPRCRQAAAAAPSARPLRGAPARRRWSGREGGGRQGALCGEEAEAIASAGGGETGRGGMALPVLSSSGVRFRRVLAHFPQELSLAFAYGSGVFRQEGASAGHSEVRAAGGWAGAGRCGRGPCYCGSGGGRPCWACPERGAEPARSAVCAAEAWKQRKRALTGSDPRNWRALSISCSHKKQVEVRQFTT